MSRLKIFLKNVLRKLFKLGLFVGILILAGSVIKAEWHYRNGLEFLPDNTAPSASSYPDKLLHAQWVALGGEGSIPATGLFPVQTLTRIAYHVVGSEAPQAVLPNDKVTLQSATLLLLRSKRKISTQKWREAKQLAAGWINQNWSATQKLNTVLAETHNGLGCTGVEQTARRLLGKSMSRLTVRESAVLVALDALPFLYLKRSKKMLARTNHIINQLSRHFPDLYSNLQPYAKLPYGVLALKRAKAQC